MGPASPFLDGLRRSGEFVEGARLEGSDRMSPTCLREILLIFRDQEGNPAIGRGDCHASADDGPIAGQQKHVLRESAQQQVPMVLAKRTLNAIDAFLTAHF